MEFITDITVFIDEAAYKDSEKLKKILRPYSPEKTARGYKVQGSFKEVDGLSLRLSAVKLHSSPDTHRRAPQQDEQASSQIPPVEVSRVVMDYIKQKCATKLETIQGNSFAIETNPDLRTANNKPRNTIWVTFRPQQVSPSPVRGDFVRQRFITFYQRTASDLQVTSITVSPHDLRDLQKKFPQLLFNPSRNKCEVTGPFVHIAKLKEFLSQNMSNSSKSPAIKGAVNATRSRTSGPSSLHREDPEGESCPICMEAIVTTEKETLQCKHSFCRNCLKTAFEYKPVCPTCGKLYGTLTGTQPDGGKMEVTSDSSCLPGYERYGTIMIHYYIPSGIQKEEHPNPGQPYEGASRRAYLPDCSEGRRILQLLRRAFEQKLIFTVGRSTTSGRSNIVTWNDIHHKTSTHGGPTHYGYPDPDYLSRVRDELKVKGIE